MNEIVRQPNPPQWAEALLETLLRPEDRESVSGDLLEEYRDSVVPARGRAAADRWYVRQVAGLLWRTTWLWGVLFGAAAVTRTALDWFVPPTNFHTRAVVTTYTAIALFIAAGFWVVWRSRSLPAAAFAAISISIIAGLIRVTSTAVMIALWHDQDSRTAIAHSGGLGEVFALPVFMFVPAIVLATLGGFIAKATLFLRRASNM